MAKLLEQRFRSWPGCNFWASPDADICHRALAKRFDLPERVKVIWIAIYDQPDEHRWPVKIVNAPEFSPRACKVVALSHEDCGENEVTDQDLDRLLRPLVSPKTLYAEVTYEQ